MKLASIRVRAFFDDQRRALMSPITLLLLALLALYLFWQRQPQPLPLIHGDGHYTYLWGRSLAFDHDLRLENDYALCGDPWELEKPVAPGLGPRNVTSIGGGILWAPLLMLAKLLMPGVARNADPMIAGGCSGPYADFATTGTALMAIAALYLAYRCAIRHGSPRAALIGVALAGLVTPIVSYVGWGAAHSHGPSAFAVALFLERWDARRGERSMLGWMGLGALLGLAMLTRAQSAVFAIAPLWEWLAEAREAALRRRHRSLLGLVAKGTVFVLAAAVVFVPQMLAWKITFGKWLVMPQGPTYMRWTSPDIVATLFGSFGSLLAGNPFIYLSLFGLFVALRWQRTRALAATLLVVFALSTYVNASVWDWWGGAAYPGRRFSELTFVWAVGAAFAAGALERWVARRPVLATGTLLVIAIALGAVFNRVAWYLAPQREAPSNVSWDLINAKVGSSIWEAIGNPFSLPGSIPFAIRYGVHPRRFDMMHGYGVFYENWFDYSVSAENLELGRDLHDAYLVDGFATHPIVVDGQWARATTKARARLLFPIFRANLDAFELRWKGAESYTWARIRWNGRELFAGNVPPTWTVTHILFPRDVACDGINDVTIEIPDGRLVFARLHFVQKAGTWEPPRYPRDRERP